MDSDYKNDIPSLDIKTVIADIKADATLSPMQRAIKLNEAVQSEAATVAYDHTLDRIESDSLREYADSPVVQQGAPEWSKHQVPTSGDLMDRTDLLEDAADRRFDQSRQVLLDQVRELIDDQHEIWPRTWADLAKLDGDGVVSLSFADLGTLAELEDAARSQERVTTNPQGVDYSKSVSEDRKPDRVGLRQDQIEDVVERHRREASGRPSSQPIPIGDLLKGYVSKSRPVPDEQEEFHSPDDEMEF